MYILEARVYVSVDAVAENPTVVGRVGWSSGNDWPGWGRHDDNQRSGCWRRCRRRQTEQAGTMRGWIPPTSAAAIMCMSRGIGVSQWIIEGVAVAVKRLRIARLRHDGIRLDEPAERAIILARAVEVQPAIQPPLRRPQPLLEPLPGEAVLRLQGKAGVVVLAVGVAHIAERVVAIPPQ